jgi:septum formation protein
VRELVLASSSPYRAELLTRLGLPFECRSPDVDETPAPGEAPEAQVRRLALDKARAVAARHPHALVIGSDQVAVCGDEVLGKPGSAARAREQLTRLSGRSVTFLTSLCLLDAPGVTHQLAVVPTRVRFRRLGAAEIGNYVDRERPLDCAGAFKSEGLGIALFEAIEGRDPTALIGLPLIELCRMLRHAGVHVLG